MSAERLAEVRARLEAATPGPWEAMGSQVLAYGSVDTYDGPVMVTLARMCDTRGTDGEGRTWVTSGNACDNAALIAHAPDDLRYLLDRVEKLERVREKILADHHVREAFRAVDHARRIKGTPEWWDFRDNIPDGAFVDIDVLNELRDLDSTPEATHG